MRPENPYRESKLRTVYQHDDGRICRWLAYSLETATSQSGLLRDWFHGLPPDMRRCHRLHDGTDGSQVRMPS